MFMSGYTVFLGPFAGIMVTDYWLVHRCKVDVPAMYNPHGRYRYTCGFVRVSCSSLALPLAMTREAHTELAGGLRRRGLRRPHLPGAHQLDPPTRIRHRSSGRNRIACTCLAYLPHIHVFNSFELCLLLQLVSISEDFPYAILFLINLGRVS